MNSNYERGESLKIYVWMNYMSVPRNARMIYAVIYKHTKEGTIPASIDMDEFLSWTKVKSKNTIYANIHRLMDKGLIDIIRENNKPAFRILKQCEKFDKYENWI